MVQPKQEGFRPTLYDFLANRAIDFYKSNESELTRPANQFHLNEAKYLLPVKDFVKIDISNPDDSLSLKYYALKNATRPL
jgi:hypothetical protein